MISLIEIKKWRKIADKTMRILTFCCVLIVLTPLFGIIFYVTINGASAVSFEFLTQLPKPVGEKGGGFGNAIQGSFIVVGIASLIGIPIGVLAGIYLSEFGNSKLALITRFLADVLTGVPSIVAGIFGYTLVVLYFKKFSALAGGVALSVIMIPIIARTTEESMKLVPDSLREGAYALGIRKWITTLVIVISTARSGIVTGILLAIARIMGETAPLLFTSFNNRFWAQGIDQPVATIPVQIYTYAITPFPEWHAQAWGGAFILLIMTLSLNIGVRIAVRKRVRIT
ncbi:MAG: phosphate ABC transporter permease PstA [Methanocellales archaeon]